MVESIFSVSISEANAGEGSIHRSILSPNELMKTPAKDVETLYDVFQYAANSFKERKGFGYRILEDTITTKKQVTTVVDGVEKKEDKTWTYFQLSDYNYYSYNEAFDIAKSIGFGLLKLGFKKDDKLQISASTSAEWMFMAHGAFTQSLTIVTAYDTLGADGLQHAISESEANVCFMNTEQLPLLDKILDKCPTINTIIYRGEYKADAAVLERLKLRSQVRHILSYSELIDLGKSNPADVNKPQGDDLCCIMYTSGSTGNPKGVMLTHGNVVAAIGGVCRMLQHLLEPNDTMMAYLPLAHVLEFLVENLCIFLGVTLGYGSIRTLTDASVKNCVGDLQAFGPTIMTGVPQVWETIKKTVLSKVAERGPRVEKIFAGALGLKKYLSSFGLPVGFLNKVVFNNVKKQLGGRLRYCLSGGAPVSANTQEFLSYAVCPLLVGYGMTESCGMCAIMAPEQWGLSEVGSPVPCVEVKLVDQPELGYVSKRHDGGREQGEIWIRGPSITSGYYKRDDITQETITKDGWLKTGDIGEWTERGTLNIIDRVKNLVKLSNGEYIALEKLESVYKSCYYIENMCVHADSMHSKPVGLIVPIEAPFRKFLAENGIENKDWKALCESKDARQTVLKSLQEHAKNSGLKGNEIISDLWICKDLWTPEMGLLTAAQKLKRQEVSKVYDKELKLMLSTK